MSFGDWESFAKDPGLDLQVPLFLYPDQAKAGGEHLVSFCRSSRKTPRDRPIRSPVQCVILVPKGATDGTTLQIKKEGDQVGSVSGNLFVTIRLKRST